MKLEENLKLLQKVCIAYSGGVDSNFLLHKCIEVLGKQQVYAVMVYGSQVSLREYEDAINYLQEAGIQYSVVDFDVFGIHEFKNNDKKRCYFCKKALMNKVIDEAKLHGFDHVIDGKNVDDGKVYRPGGQAAIELGIISPLEACGYTKQMIREESLKLNLPTWNKPANACLASRFPYGTILTKELFEQVEKAETILIKNDIIGGRARVHDSILRLEVDPKYFNCIINDPKIIHELKELGFQYVTLDLEGFRSGSYDK